MAQIDLKKLRSLVTVFGEQIDGAIDDGQAGELDGNVLMQHVQASALIDIAESLRVIAEDHK